MNQTFRPIIFSGAMVRAIKAETKDQTRRLVKDPDDQETGHRLYCYRGDRLWVRESFTQAETGEFFYKADGLKLPKGLKWKPSIHMPKQACRLVLVVTLVTMQKLQDISPADALAEGINSIVPDPKGILDYSWKVTHSPKDYLQLDPINRFRLLWQSLHGPQSWEDNPSVWVVRFRALKGEQLDKALYSLNRGDAVSKILMANLAEGKACP